MPPLDPSTEPQTRRAWSLIVLFGVISLLSDFVYQAGRSLNGPYLAELGADAALVGAIAGVAEFLGYGLRLVIGRWVDRSRAYWAFTLAGYALVASVPLLALAGTWQVAALFIVVERASKAVRSPAKDTLLSLAARRVGTGRGFAVHKLMDQVGAILGPLTISLFLAATLGSDTPRLWGYQQALAWLAVPFALLLVVVGLGWRQVPRPETLESDGPRTPVIERLSATFWWYTAFTALVGLGFVNFTLLAFHAQTTGLLAPAAIPLAYAAAMAVAALAGFIAGRWYDRRGLRVLAAVPVLTALVPFLGFLGGSTLTLVLALLVYGASLGLQETVVKAGIADLTSVAKRGTGYGLFHALHGLGLLGAGVVMGALYQVSPLALGLFTVGAEALAFVILVRRLAR